MILIQYSSSTRRLVRRRRSFVKTLFFIVRGARFVYNNIIINISQTSCSCTPPVQLPSQKHPSSEAYFRVGLSTDFCHDVRSCGWSKAFCKAFSSLEDVFIVYFIVYDVLLYYYSYDSCFLTKGLTVSYRLYSVSGRRYHNGDEKRKWCIYEYRLGIIELLSERW